MRIVLTLLLLSPVLCLAACSGDASIRAPQRISFEADALGSPPEGFQPAETRAGGTPGAWKVVEGIDPDDPSQVVEVETSNTGQTYNLLLSEDPYAADFSMSVYLIPRSGEEDQGGGLLWRASDTDNYYVARWNPLEDNLRLYTVVAGERSQLASADVSARPQMWHRLEVTMRGALIEVGLDGETLIEHEDETFSAAGHIGLWTKADASTLFDLLEWEEAR